MNAMSFDDTLEVQFIVISSLISSNIGEALKRCTEILLQLGICVPSNISQEELANETEQTIRFALGITPELLLNYKIMTDQKMLVTQKFLSLLLLVTHHKKPELYHYLILKMIKMVLSHGELYCISPTIFLFVLTVSCNFNCTKAFLNTPLRYLYALDPTWQWQRTDTLSSVIAMSTLQRSVTKMK
jgi:hypothetical protein